MIVISTGTCAGRHLSMPSFIGCDIVEFAFMPDALGATITPAQMARQWVSILQGLEFSADTRFPYMATT